MGTKGTVLLVPKPIDIVIPYKKTQDDLELRYALRSIEKNFKPVRDVYIVGDRPHWLQNIIHIPNRNNDHKRVNVGYGIRMALWRDELSRDFALWHDDMFLLEPIDEIPLWHGKSLKEFSALYNGIYPSSYYTQAINNTDLPGEIPHFELHTPFMADKELLAKQLGDEIATRSYLMRTMYLVNNSDREKWEYHQDVKIHSFLGAQGWQNEERFKTFVSSADNVFLGVVYPVLKEMFPEPSRYEAE